jgi:hypothetical protein
MMAKKKTNKAIVPSVDTYDRLVSGITQLLEQARTATVRTVNGILTATYWEVGRRIVEFEQGGTRRAEYGEEIVERLGRDLADRYGRGYSRQRPENCKFASSVPLRKKLRVKKCRHCLHNYNLLSEHNFR